MIETHHLVPPVFGCCSNPVLYGIAQAIAEALPLGGADMLPREAVVPTSSAEASDDVMANEAVGG